MKSSQSICEWDPDTRHWSLLRFLQHVELRYTRSLADQDQFARVERSCSLDVHIILSLGVLLAAALIGAILAEQIRVPKVTAYLLVGLLLGPHALGLLPAAHAKSLEPFNDMAMALVLFNLGCQFSLDRFRVLLRKLIPISAGEQFTCLLLVAIGTGAATGSVTTGLLLGIMAMATAPATTVLVLKEAQSEGPVTDLCGGLVAFNNLTCIVVFELAYVGIHIVAGDQPGSAFSQIGDLLRHLALATAIGAVGGLLVSFFCGMIAGKRWLVLLIGVMAMVLGTCEALHVPYLLAFLTMGLTVVNTSTETKNITKELDQTTTVLCVMFFVLHGSHLDVRAFVSAGVIGLLYILMRMIGKYVGTHLVARRNGEGKNVQSWLGLTLMAQAGIAIAISADIVERGVEHAAEIQTIILGSVVFFEIAGPLLIRHGVLQAGEMPLGQAIHHSGTAPREQLNKMWNRLLVALGREHSAHLPPAEMTVVALIAPEVQGIPQSANFRQVIDHIERSHDNVFPVVDEGGVPIGVIRYSAISSAVFDPDAVDLICADDLAQPLSDVVALTDTANHVIELFNRVSDDCLVVADPDADGKLCGVIRRSAVMNLLLRGHR